MRIKGPELLEAEKKAKEVEDSLSALDFQHDCYVKVVAYGAGEFIFHRAFFLSYRQWYFVFSEHNDFKVFHEDDVRYIHQYKITVTMEKAIEVEDFKPYERSRKGS